MDTCQVFKEVNREALVAAVARARSLDDIVGWLKSQPGVKSVEVAAYLLKSEPPQRDLMVECGTDDGSTATKILNVYDLGGGRFQFNELRDN
jgi:hypothetical protein